MHMATTGSSKVGAIARRKEPRRFLCLSRRRAARDRIGDDAIAPGTGARRLLRGESDRLDRPDGEIRRTAPFSSKGGLYLNQVGLSGVSGRKQALSGVLR